MLLPKRGSYRGRLAFDPDSGFHTDGDGRKLVTEDEGKTWRYAKRSDSSHISRYQRRVLVVDTTANQEIPEPHHFTPAFDDPHANGLQFDPDEKAAVVTSHTEAYRG
jgi:hypothetical protein